MKTECNISDIIPITQIKHISPSRYQSLKGCALREIWGSNKTPVFLPNTGASYIGNIIHILFEEVGHGSFLQTNDPILTAHKRWDELILELENKLKNHWLERHLVPLSKNVNQYHVLKARALKQIKQMLTFKQDTSFNKQSQVRTYFEKFLRSPDGLILGRIDCIIEAEDRVIIRDYKTGNIFTDDDNGIRPAYNEQMQMYGALYGLATQKWNISLELAPINGEIQKIVFDKYESVKLLEKASAELNRINTLIQTESNFTLLINALAARSISECIWCSYRPICLVYHHFLQTIPNKTTIKDIIGRCESIKNLGNGTVSLKIIMSELDSIPILIRGLSGGEIRHPALKNITINDVVGVFNLTKTSNTNEYTENKLTSIFLFSQDFIDKIKAIPV